MFSIYNHIYIIVRINKTKTTMKIGIDARICDEGWYYSQYCWEVIIAFCNNNTEHDIVIYRNCDIDCDIERSFFRKTKLNRLSHYDEGKARRTFTKERFGMMVFFDHHIPHRYKGNFIVLIEDLKEVFFPKKKFLARRKYQYKLQRAIKHSEHIVVMDWWSALELNEKLNVPEDKIERISGFFPKIPENTITEIPLDVKTKHNLRWEYFIYDSGNEMHNNFDRILKTLHKLKNQEILLYLIILCEETNKDLDIRSKAIEYDIAEQILFLWPVGPVSEKSYYTQSAGVIFSSIYESFPFHFSKALSYNVPIFANDIPVNKEVMQDTITYLDPLSIHNITDTIISRLKNPIKVHYDNINRDFSAKRSAGELQNIIELKK